VKRVSGGAVYFNPGRQRFLNVAGPDLGRTKSLMWPLGGELCAVGLIAIDSLRGFLEEFLVPQNIPHLGTISGLCFATSVREHVWRLFKTL
jgi:hypothetical protein